MKNCQLILPLLLCGGLSACVTAPTQENKVENKPEVNKEQTAEQVTKQPEPIEAEQPVIELKAKKTSDGKLILGEKEWVYVPGLEEAFRSRIDTGATTSSISAVDIVDFERDGKDWVKFKIEHDGIQSKEIALPVERWVKIRQSSAEGTQRRPVVLAWIQIGDLKEKTEFTLTDRTHLSYPMLLGRSFFKDVAVVDVSRKYVQDKPQSK
ncbi:ATP-dependent Zn protease [Vibrio navarrensis]|uniref:ATP-dependent zinc protease family protein n=1 Tax=Vibrio navarrensis TaxID=29495 RepID=UPI001869CF12|nr:ATP-dependent zinc protease [Vibrio navarrensis]MBE3668401.1 ATP-dependent Zn protease [Vibrio navarrensis]MBE4591188.1 ATP-dependent Zn protease [Vibrio navarrensis]